MEEDEDEINKLLAKIQNLEKKNEQIKKKIQDKENEIKNFKNNDAKTESKKKISKSKKITVEDDRKAELRFKNEINFLNNNSLQIKENLVEKTIEFVAKETYGIMYIIGDFTGWEPEIMQKDKNVFRFKVVLIKGFKYYYFFQSNDETIIDCNNTYEENPVNLQLQNYLDLNQNRNEKTNYFDYKTDSNILKTAQRNYLLLKIDDDLDNTLFLEKFQRHMANAKKDSSISEEDQIIESIQAYYNNLIKKTDTYDKYKYDNLKLYLNNRILVQNSPIMREVQYQYKILSISKDNYSLICMRLYDHNKIKLNSIYYSDFENCWIIPFDEIVLKPPNDRDKLYHLLSAKESQKIIKEFENDKENIIIVHFNDLDDLNKSSKSITRKYGKNNNFGDLINPIRIEPDDVELNDYEYYYLNKEIVKIRNKDDNSYIEYQIIEDNKKNKKRKIITKEIKDKEIIDKNIGKEIINKEIEKEGSNQKEKIGNIHQKEKLEKEEDKKRNIQKKELIKKEKMKRPAQYFIYYTIFNHKVLILHCHIIDRTFRYKKITIIDINDSVDPHSLKRDKLYINGNDVVLINNSKGPIKLYFKGKKVQMESKLIYQNKLYRIESANKYNSIFHQMIVSTNTIKSNKSLSNDIVEKCQEYIYRGKEILNGVDVKVEYNNTFDNDMMLAISPCLLEELSAEEENTLKKQHQQQQQKSQKNVNKSYEMQKLDLIEREMAKYIKYTIDDIKKMTTSEKDNIAITLEDYKSTMDIISTYVQDNELWDMIEKVSEIINEIENLLNLFDS